MKNFLFNQLSPSLFDCGKITQQMFCPDHANIGEIVSIGRSKNAKAIFIPSDINTQEEALRLVDFFDDPDKINFPPDCSKVIQYVPSIKGYLFAYEFFS